MHINQKTNSIQTTNEFFIEAFHQTRVPQLLMFSLKHFRSSDICWLETTDDMSNDHFRSYGNIVGSVIAKVAETHTILGRMNRGQNSYFRTNCTKSNDMNIRTKKIFVGGLSTNLTEDDFKFYFEKFNRITDVVVMHDNVTHWPRGFGFITFETEDSVEDVMQKNFHELCGKLVEVKQAVPKEISTGGTTSGMRDINFSGSHQQVPYSPRYDVLPSYSPIPGYTGYPYGMFTGGYPVNGYGVEAAEETAQGSSRDAEETAQGSQTSGQKACEETSIGQLIEELGLAAAHQANLFAQLRSRHADESGRSVQQSEEIALLKAQLAGAQAELESTNSYAKALAEEKVSLLAQMKQEHTDAKDYKASCVWALKYMEQNKGTHFSRLDQFRQTVESSLERQEAKLRKLSIEYDEELYPHLVSSVAERRLKLKQNQYLHEQNRGQNSYFITNGTKSNHMNIRTKKKGLENFLNIQNRLVIRRGIQKRLWIRQRNVSGMFPSRFRSQGVPKRARGPNKRFGASLIFVGGLSANLTEDDFKFYFEKFGRITDVVVMHDNVTHRTRRFGFITFETEDSVEDVMQKNFHELCGKLVEVKRAVPKETNTGPNVPYSPKYDVLPSYTPIPGYTGYPYGMFTGGYPVNGYGLGQVSPRIPWGPLPMPVYPAYLNGGHGLMGIPANGLKLKQNQYLHEQNRGQNSYFITNGTKSNHMNIRTKKKGLENFLNIQNRLVIRRGIQKRLWIRQRNVSGMFPSRFRSQGVPKRARGPNKRFGASLIFVGGLSANLTEDDFKFYFEKFGRITDVVVMHDNVTHRTRRFGFITFETEDSVEDVMQKNFHELCGKLVEVKRAVPKETNTGPNVPYSPKYDVLPSYTPIPGYTGYPYGMFTGGYPVNGYGLGQVSPRIPWGPLPMPVYPAYLNSRHGLMGVLKAERSGIHVPQQSIQIVVAQTFQDSGVAKTDNGERTMLRGCLTWFI
ncbi:RNA-binding protein 1 [Artemisia annua]|uniref:RNA-binding protein 1 n=1 Tax=Artemisia annua TaxID=35608 RepID=A0A2U1LGW9_ARTAN|nr:RNA-binding protein 1 [Artemisia annua]